MATHLIYEGDLTNGDEVSVLIEAEADGFASITYGELAELNVWSIYSGISPVEAAADGMAPEAAPMVGSANLSAVGESIVVADERTGHWYALVRDWQFGETLVGWPMGADDDPVADTPAHPAEMRHPFNRGGEWYEITAAAEECDDEAIVRRLKRGAAPAVETLARARVGR